jgi:hypothetical protein
MTTNDSSRAVRWLVIVALSVATAGMFLISMRANYLYGRSIGQSAETQEALAWANVGADIWKAFGLIVVSVLWRSQWRRAAIVTCLTWFICLSFSISSAIGIYVQERTTLTGSREAKHASYEDAQKELAEIERKRKGLRQHRSVGQVEAAIAGVLARPIMVGERVRGTVSAFSTNCTKDDKRTAAACAEVAELREELAVANENAKLELRATDVRQQIAKLRGTGGSLAPDPVGLFWEWLTRGWITVRAVGFGLPLFFALMIETVSAFGPLAIAAYAEATRRQTTDDTSRTVAAGRAVSRFGEGSRPDATIIEPETGQVVHYMADRTEPTGDPAAVAFHELHSDYVRWCNANALQPLSRDVFTTEFDRVRELPQLEGKIRKFGSRYYGIRLIEPKIARLPARKRGDT